MWKKNHVIFTTSFAPFLANWHIRYEVVLKYSTFFSSLDKTIVYSILSNMKQLEKYKFRNHCKLVTRVS